MMFRLSLLSGLLLLTAAADAVEVDSDCTTCHSTAPVPQAHPPVSSVSATSCSMCHAASVDDGYFQAVHAKHSAVGLGCSSCHGSAADDALQAQLKALLAQ